MEAACRISQPVQRGFKFEAMWLRAVDYREILEQAWAASRDGNLSLHSTWSNLNHVAGSLRTWSKESFGCDCKQIGKLEHRLMSIRASHVSANSLEEERVIKGHCANCLSARKSWLGSDRGWTGSTQVTRTHNFFMPELLRGDVPTKLFLFPGKMVRAAIP